MAILEIRNLHVSVEGKEILKGVDLTVNKGEVVAIMGPNGSGKSTLANAIMGNPKYEITSGDVLLDGQSILGMKVDERARLGILMTFQYPYEVPGVTLESFLRTAYNSMKGIKADVKERGKEFMSALKFRQTLKQKMKDISMDEEFMGRYLNTGFSGGEKKKCEILQLSILEPKIAVLDETDTGLDIDALKVVADGVNRFSGDSGILIITHYQRILNYIKPSKINILMDGKIVKTGGSELSEQLERQGYDWIKKGG